MNADVPSWSNTFAPDGGTFERWTNYNASFVATGSETLEFRSMGSQLSYGDFLDNVSVQGDVSATDIVPEPSSVALIAAGLAMMGGAVRRRRR